MSKISRPELYARRRKKRFDVHHFSIKTKIILAEIAGIISLVLVLCGGIALEIRTIIRYFGL